MAKAMTYQVEIDEVGDKIWRYKGKLHREYGPAVECADGTKEWFINGKLHREDGPAVELASGRKFWYLNGESVTEEEHQNRTQPTLLLTVAEIEKLLGYKVKIIK